MGEDLFLRRSYAAGARGHFDALAVHPYPLPMSRPDYLREIRRQLGSAREIMTKRGDATKPMWVTEIGYSTYKGPEGVSEAEQATRLAATYRMLERVPKLPVVIVHRLQDTPDPHWREGGMGLLRADLSPKPAYSTAAVLLLHSP